MKDDDYQPSQAACEQAEHRIEHLSQRLFYILITNWQNIFYRDDISRVHIAVCDGKQPCLRWLHGGRRIGLRWAHQDCNYNNIYTFITPNINLNIIMELWKCTRCYTTHHKCKHQWPRSSLPRALIWLAWREQSKTFCILILIVLVQIQFSMFRKNKVSDDDLED